MLLGLSSTCATLTAVSCLGSFIATVFHAIAFGTRRWIISTEDSPFTSIGFHEACFDRCMDPYCPASGSLDVVYDGCTWFWNWYFEEVWIWLLPDWFLTCRNLAIINVPLITVTFIVLAITTSLAFRGRYTIEVKNSQRLATAVQVLCFITAVMLLTAAIINMILMTSMYTNGFQRYWMPMPEKNGFGYSFWLEFTATLILIICFLCILFGGIVKTLWMYGDKDPRYSEDMMLGKGSSMGATTPTPPKVQTGGASSLAQALQMLEHKTV